MIQNLSTLLVYVHDMPRCITFYRDTLGLRLKMQSPEWSEFELGKDLALGLHIAGADSAPPSPGWLPTFRVADVKAAVARVREAGSAVVMDFHDIPGGVVIDVTDPDGNTLSLEQTGVSCADLGVASA